MTFSGIKPFFLGLMLMLTLMGTPAPALAHKVILFAWVEDGQIHAQASFGSKRPAMNCTIQAFDQDHTRLFEGKTDDRGELSFAVPAGLSSDLVLKLDAGTGHSAAWTIPAAELTEPATPGDLEDKMTQKENLEKGPSFFRITAGILLIFGLAWIARRVKQKRTEHRA